jgi:hypothetical protein
MCFKVESRKCIIEYSHMLITGLIQVVKVINTYAIIIQYFYRYRSVFYCAYVKNMDNIS